MGGPGGEDGCGGARAPESRQSRTIAAKRVGGSPPLPSVAQMLKDKIKQQYRVRLILDNLPITTYDLEQQPESGARSEAGPRVDAGLQRSARSCVAATRACAPAPPPPGPLTHSHTHPRARSAPRV